MVEFQPGRNRCHRAAQFAGPLVELLGRVNALAAGLPLAQEGVGLLLHGVAFGHRLQQGLLGLGLAGLPLCGPLQGLTQLVAPLGQPLLIQMVAVVGRHGLVNRQGRFLGGGEGRPTAVAAAVLLPSKAFGFNAPQPALPVLPKLVPLAGCELLHAQALPVGREKLLD